ncbi:CorA family divalent cation transporter [uncultured Enorma sp.]|uniref:CorA family divalent cation transporter n=1 Tax=uncultured Enorma sp. TaxID=1714346 RepID=UPI0028057939|nr:CorA family divalent cation transporter [uncultured Enorma sp.]
MAHVWTIEAGHLVAVPDVEVGELSSRIELMGFDDVEQTFAERSIREVFAQAEHVAVPFVEQVGEYAAGIVVLPAGAAKVSAAARFGFLLQAHALVLFDDRGVCEPVIARLAGGEVPVESPAAVLCALLRAPLRDHPALLSRVRDDFEQIEERLLEGKTRIDRPRMISDARHMRGLDVFYQGISDMLDTLANGGATVLDADDRARFAALARQVDRLVTRLESLQDFSLQVHGMYQEEIDLRQNSIMQWLTVVATIAMPLTFITSWYGMNFRNMALINAEWGYPVAAALCLLVALGEIAVFHRRGWLKFGDGKRRRR